MKNNKQFPEINTGIKEYFQKERKYDSFIDEAKRSISHGKSFVIKNEKVNNVFKDCISFAMKKWKVNFDDLFKNLIIEVKNGKKSNKVKITEFIKNDKKSIISIQFMKDKIENRTTIEVYKSIFFKKNIKILVVDFMKNEKPIFGLKDELRKKAFQKNVIYKVALLARNLSKKYHIIDDSWINKIITKTEKKGRII